MGASPPGPRGPLRDPQGVDSLAGRPSVQKCRNAEMLVIPRWWGFRRVAPGRFSALQIVDMLLGARDYLNVMVGPHGVDWEQTEVLAMGRKDLSVSEPWRGPWVRFALQSHPSPPQDRFILFHGLTVAAMVDICYSGSDGVRTRVPDTLKRGKLGASQSYLTKDEPHCDKDTAYAAAFDSAEWYAGKDSSSCFDVMLEVVVEYDNVRPSLVKRKKSYYLVRHALPTHVYIRIRGRSW